MKTFTNSYSYNGKTYVVHLEAEDFADASKRLRAIGMTAQVDGELVLEGNLYPASVGRFIRLVRNSVKDMLAKFSPRKMEYGIPYHMFVAKDDEPAVMHNDLYIVRDLREAIALSKEYGIPRTVSVVENQALAVEIDTLMRDLYERNKDTAKRCTVYLLSKDQKAIKMYSHIGGS